MSGLDEGRLQARQVSCSLCYHLAPMLAFLKKSSHLPFVKVATGKLDNPLLILVAHTMKNAV